MHGNVAEWCEEIGRSESFYLQLGGSWNSSASACGRQSLDEAAPAACDFNVGFRVLLRVLE